MALTPIQRDVLRLIADRRSRDIDPFHDSEAALVESWDADRSTLLSAGFALELIRERPTFVEAVVARGAESKGRV
jgi:hypothetical protein